MTKPGLETMIVGLDAVRVGLVVEGLGGLVVMVVLVVGLEEEEDLAVAQVGVLEVVVVLEEVLGVAAALVVEEEVVLEVGQVMVEVLVLGEV